MNYEYLYQKITSPDLIRLILGFHSEAYLQERIRLCEEIYEQYSQNYNEYFATYRYYNEYIARCFHRIFMISSTDLGVSDLMTSFILHDGHTHLDYIHLQGKYLASKRILNELFDSESSLFCLETMIQIRSYNKQLSTRKLLYLKTIDIVINMFNREIDRLSDSLTLIRDHSSLRIRVLQFIVHWMYNRTANSWHFWWMYYFQSTADKQLYRILTVNRKLVQQFLEIKIV